MPAKKRYGQAAELDDYETLHALGLLAEKQGNWGEAEDWYWRANKAGGYTAALQDIVGVLDKEGRRDAANAVWTQLTDFIRRSYRDGTAFE